MIARTSTALAAALALLSSPLLASPAAAQDREAPPRLEDLIPDAAVENPEDWAAEGVPAQDRSDAQAQEPLGADAPMAQMPAITVPWPEGIDLPQLAPLEPAEEPVEFVRFDEQIPRVETGTEERVSDQLVLAFPTDRSLFPQRKDFVSRFESLSTVGEYDDDGNIARLAVQAREDEDLLNSLLRVYGYFDGQVTRTIGESEPGEQGVRFDIVPGERYRYGAIDLGDLAAADSQFSALRRSFDIETGDLISLDAIVAERSDLAVALGESGFPFAEIDAPALLVDHARDEGDLTMAVEPGGRYVLGTVVSSDPEFLSSRHLTRIARWDAGDIYRRSDEVDLRRAMLGTGLLGSVDLTPVVVQEPTESEPGVVDIEADMTPAPLRTLAGSIGYGTEEGFRLEASWEHRNLFPPEGMLRVRGIAGTQEQLAGITFRKNNFRGRDRILTLDAFASTIDYSAYNARTASLIGTYERVSTLLFQKGFSWSVGVELVATQENERTADGSDLARETYLIGAVPLFAQLDDSDDLLDPTKGWRLSGRLSPEVSDNNGVQSFYVRSQVDASYYRSVGENTVLAGRVRVASIPGAPLGAIAPSRRLYAGGGGSVRGYGYREIGPLNDSGDPLGGRSLVELSAEARIATGLMDGAISVVPFVDAGSVGLDPTPDFSTIKFGAGVGVRYDTGFGPLRVDVAFPLNPGPNDNWVAVYVGLGQAF